MLIYTNVPVGKDSCNSWSFFLRCTRVRFILYVADPSGFPERVWDAMLQPSHTHIVSIGPEYLEEKTCSPKQMEQVMAVFSVIWRARVRFRCMLAFVPFLSWSICVVGGRGWIYPIDLFWGNKIPCPSSRKSYWYRESTAQIEYNRKFDEDWVAHVLLLSLTTLCHGQLGRFAGRNQWIMVARYLLYKLLFYYIFLKKKKHLALLVAAKLVWSIAVHWKYVQLFKLPEKI